MKSPPHIVGWHHCGYFEQWGAAERGDPPRNESGFMDPFEGFHMEWADVIAEVNSKAAESHRAAK